MATAYFQGQPPRGWEDYAMLALLGRGHVTVNGARMPIL